MGFDNLIQQLLGVPITSSKITIIKPSKQKNNNIFDAYKKCVARCIIKNDNVSKDSAEVKQILNSANLEQVESFLRQMGYCEKGILKTYRMFISREPYDEQDY